MGTGCPRRASGTRADSGAGARVVGVLLDAHQELAGVVGAVDLGDDLDLVHAVVLVARRHLLCLRYLVGVCGDSSTRVRAVFATGLAPGIRAMLSDGRVAVGAYGGRKRVSSVDLRTPRR